MVCVVGGIAISQLVGGSEWCVCGLVSEGGRGGNGVGVALLVVGALGWVLCWLGVRGCRRVVWVLCVRAVRSLWSLTGCGVQVRVGGGRLGIQAGLWSVGSGWLPVDGACCHGVWLGGLLVVVGCSF